MARKDWFVQAFRDLCDKGGLLDLQQLCQSESASSTGSAIHDQQGIVNLFKSHPEHFVLANPRDKASCRVFAKTGLRVCLSYSSGKCLDANCPKLHICRFFIAGACKFGDRCKFAHNLDEACTGAKLNSPSYVLERQLSLKGLFSVLLLNDSCLLPEICSHYNTGDGSYGNCIYQSKCTKLHVCRHYILEDCLYHNSCKRSHDFLAPNMKKLLSSKGFGDHMTDLLGMLRKAAHMQDAMRADAATGATSNDSQMVANMADMSVSNDSENNTDKHEICLYYLRKHCQYKDKCQCMHFDLPYHWQWHPWGWDWKDIPNMEEVEKDFCNPDYDSHIGEECKVDFLNMKLGGHLVRRFSTASSISKPEHFILTTKWCWYWKVQDGCWREYVLEKDSKAPVTSEILEKSYQENNHGVVKFEAGPWKYTLSFAEMTQQNETTKTKRDVRRRPQFVSAQKKNELLKRTKEKKENGMSPGVSIPSHWVQTSESDTLVPVAESSEEFKKVTSLFHRTLPNNKIRKVMRNQNIELWEIYRSKRERMMRRNGGKEVMELQLFHGTNPELVPAICQQNFDWRICGSNGTSYGRGSYFARNSDYSNKYSGLDPQRKSRIMFVARVLVGTFVRGQSSYLRPPAKPPSSIELHDSCVDNELNPTIFVVFEKDQVYPEYVIEYTST